jgi:hypothetical protein
MTAYKPSARIAACRKLRLDSQTWDWNVQFGPDAETRWPGFSNSMSPRGEAWDIRTPIDEGCLPCWQAAIYYAVAGDWRDNPLNHGSLPAAIATGGYGILGGAVGADGSGCERVEGLVALSAFP